MSGLGPYALRFLSACLGTLAVPLTWALGRRCFGSREGLLAALFVAVSPFCVHHAQEVRMYALFMLLATASTYALLKTLAAPRRGSGFLYLLATLGALYTHYAAFLLLGAQAVVVDALAVSIGTSHGVYVSRPELDIDRLKVINAVSPVPLVLHGGSGTPSEQVQEAIRNGITKLNVYADTRLVMNAAFSASMALIKDRPDALPDVVFKPLHDAIVALVTDKIGVAMSGGTAA